MSVFSETSGLYTSLSEALIELERRRNDEKLQQKVNNYFALYPCPPELVAEPRIVMAPPLVSPNLELKYFLDVCGYLPMRSIFYEFRKDKFVHLNFEKHYLGKLVFFRENTSGDKEITESIRVVDFEKDQGKPMDEIKTIQGENFVDFHHRLVSEYLPHADIEIHDFSETNEIGRVNKVDPLGITYLRIRGMWGIENPRKVFERLNLISREDRPLIAALMLRTKFDSFSEEDRQSITAIASRMEDIQIANPNNPAQTLDAKLIVL